MISMVWFSTSCHHHHSSSPRGRSLQNNIILYSMNSLRKITSTIDVESAYDNRPMIEYANCTQHRDRPLTILLLFFFCRLRCQTSTQRNDGCLFLLTLKFRCPSPLAYPFSARFVGRTRAPPSVTLNGTMFELETSELRAKWNNNTALRGMKSLSKRTTHHIISTNNYRSRAHIAAH